MAVQIELGKTRAPDWKLIARAQKGLWFDDIDAWLEFFDRTVPGGSAAMTMPDVIEAIQELANKISEAANPKAKTA